MLGGTAALALSAAWYVNRGALPAPAHFLAIFPRTLAETAVMVLPPALAAVAAAMAWAFRSRWFKGVAACVLAAVSVFNVLWAYEVIEVWAAKTYADPNSGAWCSANRRVLENIENRSGHDLENVSLIVAPREPWLNFATLRLFERLGSAGQPSVEELGVPRAVSEDAYSEMFPQYARGDDIYFVCTEALQVGRGPRFDADLAEKAAAAAGFQMVRDFPLPDGRKLRLWRRGG